MGLINKGGRCFAFRLLRFVRVAGILSAAFFIWPMISASASGDHMPWEIGVRTEPDGGPAPLNEKEARRFKKKVAKINRRIREKPCQDFLTAHLGDSIIEDISEKLAEHQAFSGPRSSGIKAFDAGLYGNFWIVKIRSLADSPDSPVAQAARYTRDRSVSELFRDSHGGNGRSMEAAVANYNGNPNTAFYRSMSSVGVLHEMLHVATGLGDKDLAVKLGIDITSFKGDYELASDAITEALKHNHCD